MHSINKIYGFKPNNHENHFQPDRKNDFLWKKIIRMSEEIPLQ